MGVLARGDAAPLNVGIVWDADNRLVEVKQGPTTLASFVYDGEGRRQQKTAEGVTHTYILDGDSLIEERVSTGQALRYVDGQAIDQHLAMQDGAAVTYYVADHLGSVVQATNSAGTVTLARTYDPWGTLLSGASTAGWAYTGREWDPEAGLAYYRARYYEPSLGRFLSDDPVGLEGGLNQYAYVGNDPLRFVDPLGLQHKPGGPWHPEPPYDQMRCFITDACTTLQVKIGMLSKTITAHKNWDARRKTNRHAKDIADLIRAIENCKKIFLDKCVLPMPKCDKNCVLVVVAVLSAVVMMCVGLPPVPAIP